MEIYLHFNYQNIDLLKEFLQSIKGEPDILGLTEKEILNNSMGPKDYFQSSNGKENVKIDRIPQLCYLNDLKHIERLLNNIKIFGKLLPIPVINNDIEDERQRLIYQELKNAFPEL